MTPKIISEDLMNVCPLLICIISSDGKIISVNNYFNKFFGTADENVIEKDFISEN